MSSLKEHEKLGDSIESEDAILAVDADISPEEERRIIRRVDLRLVATCGVMFCFSLMDRSNLGSAAIAGMTKDLKLTGYRYSIIALVFFTTYVAVQPFASIACRKIGPRLFLGVITFTWGVCTMCLGFPHSWGGLLGLRLLLGALEGGFFPGTLYTPHARQETNKSASPACVYLISTWYTRYEIHQRFSMFYVIGSLSSACAGILAYGLMQMNGLSGLGGWRWIFIIEGILTAIIGICGYLIMVDFPDRASESWNFLTERECQFIIRRVMRDRGDAEVPPFDFWSWAAAGRDWKVWAFGFSFFLNATVAYAISFFMPIILKQKMEFSLAASQCLVAPPYVLAAIQMYLLSVVGDRWHVRGPIILFNNVVSLVGVPLMGYASSNAVRYAGVFFVTAGAFSNFPAVMAWQSNNIRGHWKRAFSSAALVGVGSMGGVAGALVFRSQDAPSYHPGIWAILVCNCVALVLTPAMSVYFRSQNKKADRGVVLIEGWQGFRYTI